MKGGGILVCLFAAGYAFSAARRIGRMEHLGHLERSNRQFLCGGIGVLCLVLAGLVAVWE